jgi:hypothetical protein
VGVVVVLTGIVVGLTGVVVGLPGLVVGPTGVVVGLTGDVAGLIVSGGYPSKQSLLCQIDEHVQNSKKSQVGINFIFSFTHF